MSEVPGNNGTPVGIRWTIGDVSDRGFTALRLSISGAWNIFGSSAAYAVCVNTVSVAEARKKTGSVPPRVQFLDATEAMPGFIASRLDEGKAEGAGWKFAPLRLFPSRWELSIDNDCILWKLPEAVRTWLSQDLQAAGLRCLMAEDVRACYGVFTRFCPQAAFNAGIRGFPPRFDPESALAEVLSRADAASGVRVRLSGELDEQGLQTASLSLGGAPVPVPLSEVSICSPFWPHSPELGSSGAHFVGLNARHIPWKYFDTPADELLAAHWNSHLSELERLTGGAETL